jgi:hypothetical protein
MKNIEDKSERVDICQTVKYGFEMKARKYTEHTRMYILCWAIIVMKGNIDEAKSFSSCSEYLKAFMCSC